MEFKFKYNNNSNNSIGGYYGSVVDHTIYKTLTAAINFLVIIKPSKEVTETAFNKIYRNSKETSSYKSCNFIVILKFFSFYLTAHDGLQEGKNYVYIHIL